MNEVTKYKNELNTVSMRKWTKEEMDFFFVILTKAKDQGSNTIMKFSRDELERVVRPAGKDVGRIKKTLDRLANNVNQLRYCFRTETSVAYMTLFPYFEVKWTPDGLDYVAEVMVSPKFEFILNHIEDNFTKFPIDEFVSLKSTYSKTLYRQLKQFRTAGWREFRMDEFRELLAIPKSYGTSDIDKRILKICISELKPFFPELKVKKIHADKRGRPLIGLRFSWKPEASEDWIKGKFEKKSKKKINTGLPEWYANTEQKPVDPEILQKALEAQKKAGEKSKELEGEQLPFDF